MILETLQIHGLVGPIKLENVMKKIALISATILSLSVTGIASASILMDSHSRSGVTTVAEQDTGPRHHNRGHRRGHHRGPGAGLAMLQVADANGDNTVTRGEIQALQESEFDFRDRNGDGFLDIEDRSPTAQSMHAIRQERQSEGDSDHPVRRRMQRIDSNEDGRISREEFLSRENRLFDRLDANGDDAVTPDELDAAVENRRERGEARFWWRG